VNIYSVLVYIEHNGDESPKHGVQDLGHSYLRGLPRPQCLKGEFAAARLLGLLARIPRETPMSVVSVVFVT